MVVLFQAARIVEITGIFHQNSVRSSEYDHAENISLINRTESTQ
jgi:hypothetical protein